MHLIYFVLPIVITVSVPLNPNYPFEYLHYVVVLSPVSTSQYAQILAFCLNNFISPIAYRVHSSVAQHFSIQCGKTGPS